MQLTDLLCDSDLAQGCAYGVGTGARGSLPAAFVFQNSFAHETVAPSRTKNREFERPGVSGTLILMVLGVRQNTEESLKHRILRAFLNAAVEYCGSGIHTEFRYKPHCKTAFFGEKIKKQRVFHAFSHYTIRHLAEPVWIPKTA